MRARWVMFRYPPLGKKDVAPWHAVHLVDEGRDVPMCVPTQTLAVAVSVRHAPSGFVLTCCQCLGLSEVSS